MVSRIAPIALLWTAAALAAPPLTTVQDVLYKADGTRFSGLAAISWSSFEAADTSNITSHTLTVKIVDGMLNVQLVPTTSVTPSVYYRVKYNSDGKVQFEETWAVPASADPLRVRDVRVPAANLIGQDTTLPTPVQQSDVIGLTADLSARPVKSAAYAAGRAVYVNLQGALEAVSGSATDCVRVDGSAGPCGSGSETTYVDGETPSGIVDGANRQFSIVGSPNPAASLAVYRNGLLMKLGQDYTLSNRVVTFLPESAPQGGDTLLASYRVNTTEPVSGQLYPSAQVLCSGVGATIGAASDTTLGMCTIPGSLLVAGDRLEVRYGLEHAGTASDFHFEVKWGATSAVSRDASAADTLVSGRVDAAVTSSGAQLSSQSWGSALSFAATVTPAAETGAEGLTVEFLGRMATAGSDNLTLRNFTVIRFP